MRGQDDESCKDGEASLDGLAQSKRCLHHLEYQVSTKYSILKHVQEDDIVSLGNNEYTTNHKTSTLLMLNSSLYAIKLSTGNMEHTQL